MVILFGKAFNYARPANIIFPAILLMAYLLIDSDYPVISGNDWIGVAVVAISIFLGFLYFRISPVKWDEMDGDQKWQYGMHDQVVLTLEQGQEFQNLKRTIEYRMDNTKFYNVKWFLVNPVSSILILLTFL